MLNKLPMIATVMLAFLLAGCPPLPPPRPVSITVTNVSLADPYYGGLSFLVSGTGFTPNGQIGIRLFNVPGRPYVDYTNLPGLPSLLADANGNFANFQVSARCNDIPNPDLSSQGKNAELWVTDAATLSIAKQVFSPIFCLYYPIGYTPGPLIIYCPQGSRDPRCQK
jgi:hypothetical protein